MNYIDIFKKGGIHIKKENRGKFTDYCGGKVTEECIQKGKNSPDPKIRKRATFAQNARHFKHQEGGKAVKNPWYAKATVDTSAPLPVSLFDSTPVVQKKSAENNDFDWDEIKLGNNPTVSEGVTSSSIDTIKDSLPNIDNKDIPRAVRYNNPGMMRPGDNWEGMLGIRDNYIVFKSPEYGYRAMSIDLVNKIKRGVNTIRSIITAWAPESDNNPTSNYIAKVSELTGINPDEKIQETDKKKLLQIIAAMSQFESGKPANWDHIDAGWGLAFGND